MPLASILAFAASIALTTASDPAPSCRFEGEARSWTTEALSAWDRLDKEQLHTPKPATPTLVLFDRTCAFNLAPDPTGAFVVGARRYRAEGRPHEGSVLLPGGREVPAKQVSFAFPTPDGRMNFVMALPEVWRANTAEPRDPARLGMLVFMHEFAHTQQGSGLGARIDDLIARGLSPEVNDDTLQEMFSDEADYAAAVGRERDLFYASANARDDVEARRLLAEASRSMKERRTRWLVGERALFAEADDVFLSFEGSGNWAAWAWLVDPRGGALGHAEATEFVRGKRRFWSQDQGLGLMLALDRLTPDWPELAFGDGGVTADTLISRALKK